MFANSQCMAAMLFKISIYSWKLQSTQNLFLNPNMSFYKFLRKSLITIFKKIRKFNQVFFKKIGWFALVNLDWIFEIGIQKCMVNIVFKFIRFIPFINYFLNLWVFIYECKIKLIIFSFFQVKKIVSKTAGYLMNFVFIFKYDFCEINKFLNYSFTANSRIKLHFSKLLDIISRELQMFT